MKNKLLFLVCLLTIALSQAQTITFTDANFKSKLLEANTDNEIAQDLDNNFVKIDTNDDGEIQESEALEISYLDVANANISSLDELSFFTNLGTIHCGSNNIEELNFEANTQLSFISVSYNPLNQLNISNNEDLEILLCEGTMLTEIDLSSNINLGLLDCGGNLFTTLDLSNNSKLTSVDYSHSSLLQAVYHKNGDDTNPSFLGGVYSLCRILS